MSNQNIRLTAIVRLTTASIATASLSACATSPTVSGPPLVAGAPSSHIAQTYQTNTSTSATAPPSRLAGSHVRLPVATGTPYSLTGPPTATHLGGGTVNHQSGAISVALSGYTFTDPDGPTATGRLSDGTTTAYTRSITNLGVVYDYVKTLGLIGYNVGGQLYDTTGYVGIVTSAADIPTAGSASYSGTTTAHFFTLNRTGPARSAATTRAHYGSSTVNVDFASGSASVDMKNFTNVLNGAGGAYLVGAAPFDEVRGTGLAVSGAQLSGGTWEIMKNGAQVYPLGTGAVATSDGTFYGYDPTISAPDEVAGVVVITGATQVGYGTYAAD